MNDLDNAIEYIQAFYSGYNKTKQTIEITNLENIEIYNAKIQNFIISIKINLISPGVYVFIDDILLSHVSYNSLDELCSYELEPLASYPKSVENYLKLPISTIFQKIEALEKEEDIQKQHPEEGKNEKNKEVKIEKINSTFVDEIKKYSRFKEKIRFLKMLIEQ